MVRRFQTRARRGFVLIAMCAMLFLLMAVVGLAFDLGRIYIARNEAQVFTDAAAMAAAAQIDGTEAGFGRARQAVAHLPARWNFGTAKFENVTVEFSADGRLWTSDPERRGSPAAEIHMARVSAPANHIEITFLRVAGGPESFTVPARSVADSNPVRLVE